MWIVEHPTLVGEMRNCGKVAARLQNYSIHRSKITISKPIRGWVDKASATETVDLGLIPRRIKPLTGKIGIHSFPAWRSATKGTVWNLLVCGRQVGRWQLDSKTERSLRCLLTKKGNLANKIWLLWVKRWSKPSKNTSQNRSKLPP